MMIDTSSNFKCFQLIWSLNLPVKSVPLSRNLFLKDKYNLDSILLVKTYSLLMQRELSPEQKTYEEI